MSLDLSKIRGLYPYQGGWEGGCPVCRRRGQDGWNDKLRIFPNGAYQCENYPNDKRHNAQIFELAGERGRKEPFFVDPNDGGGVLYLRHHRFYFTEKGTKFEEFEKRKAREEDEAQKKSAARKGRVAKERSTESRRTRNKPEDDRSGSA